jgi:hypothetical protein
VELVPLDLSEPFHFGPKGQAFVLNPERADYNGFVLFSRPGGNS